MAKKKQKRLVFRSIVLAGLIATVIFVLVTNANSDRERVVENDNAPNFHLDRLDAESSVQLDELQGKAVMVNFWATYCEPCKDEMPYMEELYQKYQDEGFEVVAISVESDTRRINNFYNDLNLSFPSAHDRRGDVQELYQVMNLPASFFIEPDGTINHIVRGPLTLDQLEARILEILPNS